MSLRLVHGEAHLGVLRAIVQPCLPQEAANPTAQHGLPLSAIDRRMVLAIITNYRPFGKRASISSYSRVLSRHTAVLRAPAEHITSRRIQSKYLPSTLRCAGVATSSKGNQAKDHSGPWDTEGIDPQHESKHSAHKADRVVDFLEQALLDLEEPSPVKKATHKSMHSQESPSREEADSKRRAAIPNNNLSAATKDHISPAGPDLEYRPRKVDPNMKFNSPKSADFALLPSKRSPSESTAQSHKQYNQLPKFESSKTGLRHIKRNEQNLKDDPYVDLYTSGQLSPRVARSIANRIWAEILPAKKGAIPLETTLGDLHSDGKVLEALFANGHDVLNVKEAWLQLPPSERILGFRDTVLYLTVQSIDKPLVFLEATLKELPYVPWILIFSLRVLRWYRWEEIVARPEHRDRYCRLVQWAIGKSIEIQRVQSLRAVSLFLEYSTGDQGRKILDILINTQTLLSCTMCARFMNFFTNLGDIDYALKAFREAAKGGAVDNSEPMLRSCTKLLMLDYIEKDGSVPKFRILPEVLEAGIEPNIIIHNVAIMNSFKNGLSTVGWDIFEYMRARDLPADSFTYRALLENCIETADMARLSDTLAHVNDRPELANNPYLIHQTIQAIRLLYGNREQVSPSGLFNQQLLFYVKRLKLAPLHHILQLPVSSDSSADESKIEPNSVILGHMVCSYIIDAATPTTAVNLWHRFSELVANNDPIATSLTKTDHVYNTFLIFFQKSPTTLAYVLNVLKFMVEHPRPKWNVSEYSFLTATVAMLKYEKQLLAKKILELMRFRGYDLREVERYWIDVEARLAERRKTATMDLLAEVEREALMRERGKQQNNTIDLASWAEAAESLM